MRLASQRHERQQDVGCRQVPRALGRGLTSVLSLGAHLVTPRRGYLHHGIYTGGGKVVHYAGLIRSPWFGRVEEVPLERFARGQAIFVVTIPAPRFPADEIVRRAHSRLGEMRYSVLSNNCEHLCAWCLIGASYSEQVERLRALFRGLTDTTRVAARALRSLLNWRWPVSAATAEDCPTRAHELLLTNDQTAGPEGSLRS